MRLLSRIWCNDMETRILQRAMALVSVPRYVIEDLQGRSTRPCSLFSDYRHAHAPFAAAPGEALGLLYAEV